MATRFYINCPLQPGPITLDGPEAHHLATVCRLRPGNAICLFNGDGSEYQASVVEVARRVVNLEITRVATPDRELPIRLEVAAPLPKGDRGQFLIEKLTELGVASFVPLDCERSVIHPREAKLEKLHRYVIEASKQCGRNVLMEVAAPIQWPTYCLPRADDEARWLAHASGTSTSMPIGRLARCRIAVGPEGGFTELEVEFAQRHGWEIVCLGSRTLRIETAATAMACRAMFSTPR